MKQVILLAGLMVASAASGQQVVRAKDGSLVLEEVSAPVASPTAKTIVITYGVNERFPPIPAGEDCWGLFGQVRDRLEINTLLRFYLTFSVICHPQTGIWSVRIGFESIDEQTRDEILAYLERVRGAEVFGNQIVFKRITAYLRDVDFSCKSESGVQCSAKKELFTFSMQKMDKVLASAFVEALKAITTPEDIPSYLEDAFGIAPELFTSQYLEPLKRSTSIEVSSFSRSRWLFEDETMVVGWSVVQGHGEYDCGGGYCAR